MLSGAKKGNTKEIIKNYKRKYSLLKDMINGDTFKLALSYQQFYTIQRGNWL